MSGAGWRRASIACGLLSPAVFTATWVVAGFLQSRYSPRREDLSALAAETADHPWLMIGGLVATGVLTAAFAPALYVLLPTGRLRAVAAALVWLGGLGTVGLGLLRNDCSSRLPACEARVDAGTVSWHHTAHDVLSAPVFACAVVVPMLVALEVRRDPELTAFASYSLATGVALAALFTVGGLDAVEGWHGLVQRVAVTIALLWLGVVAYRALRCDRQV